MGHFEHNINFPSMEDIADPKSLAAGEAILKDPALIEHFDLIRDRRDKLLEFVMNKIPRREADVIQKYMLDSPTWTQEKIALKMGISQPRVFQLLKQGMRHMKYVCKNHPHVKLFLND